MERLTLEQALEQTEAIIAGLAPERAQRHVRGIAMAGSWNGTPYLGMEAIRIAAQMENTHGDVRMALRQIAALLLQVQRTRDFEAGKAAGAVEEREACAREAERPLIEFSAIDVLDKTPTGERIARRIRARGG